MILHKTIQHQEPDKFDKLCGKFMNEQGDKIISVDYGFNMIPVQAQPVNIPGFQQQQLQMQFVSFYCAFFRYTGEAESTPETSNGKILPLN